jgi:hypothetical protein
MIDDAFILKVERLRDAIDDLRLTIRRAYPSSSAQVASAKLKEEARRLAEVWMVEVGVRPEVRAAIDAPALADYNVQFQRLLTYSERRSTRSKYDTSLGAIVKDFRSQVIIPLKQRRNASTEVITASIERLPRPLSLAALRSVFLGHSFAADDKLVVEQVVKFFTIMGIQVITGERPKADQVSAKVRQRIESADGFVGVFTRREKLSGRDAWVTSTWIIDEKAFSLAKGKKLILLKQQGVDSIGGLQGDYEYLEFAPDNLADLILRLLEMFRNPED